MNRETVERLFSQGRLSRRQFVSALGALGVSAATAELMLGSGLGPAEAQTAVAEYLVILVLDAFRADYVNLAPMPQLAALTAGGTSFDRAWVGQIESETPTGHATIGSGSMPKNDGIIGFEWRYAGSDREALDGWPPEVIAGAMETDLRQAGTPSIALQVKAADPKAKVVAISSEKVYAADALGGWAADYILYHRRDAKTSALVPSAVPGHLPPPDFFQHPGLQSHMPLHHFTDWDYLSTVLTLAAVERFRPRVLLVNLPSADYYGHPYGGPATPGVMKTIIGGVDRNIGRIVQAYKQAGIFDKTLFVVTSDHGMVPNNRMVGDTVTKQLVKAGGGQYFFHTGGSAAYVYLRNPATAAKVAAEFAPTVGVQGSYFRESNGIYELAPGIRLSAGLEAAHRYLLDTFSGATAPDVVAAFRENTIGNQLPSAHGNHGGLNWGAQHVPLILRGPGVPAGIVSHFPARLMDVAPTVLRLFGLPSPAVDGITLADAVLDPTAREVAVQSSVAGALTTYTTALIEQSTADLAEDLRAKIAPPPSLPLRP